jgi:hypothetical protein
VLGEVRENVHELARVATIRIEPAPVLTRKSCAQLRDLLPDLSILVEIVIGLYSLATGCGGRHRPSLTDWPAAEDLRTPPDALAATR